MKKKHIIKAILYIALVVTAYLLHNSYTKEAQTTVESVIKIRGIAAYIVLSIAVMYGIIAYNKHVVKKENEKGEDL